MKSDPLCLSRNALKGAPERTNEITGLIFQIIHGSFVDGYGIRTTVFLKGCPLRCLWCCNPEGQEVYPELKFTLALCDGCGRCIGVCPTNAIRKIKIKSDKIEIGSDKIEIENNKVEIDRDLCTNCGKCIDV